jgi:two-component system, cell cycle response regulator
MRSDPVIPAAVVRSLRRGISDGNCPTGSYYPDVVSTGTEVLEALRQTSYDLVLMDVQMPEMDGLKATRLVRSPQSGVLNPRVPIVALTAHAMTGDREECLAAGMDDYLAKPLRHSELTRMIARWTSPTVGARVPPTPEGAGAARDGATRKPASTPRTPIASDAAETVSAASEPDFDPDVLRGLFGADQTLIGEILTEFRGDIPGQLAALIDASEAGDLEAIKRQAHTLKGAAGTVGARALRAAAAELERAADAEEPVPELRARIAAIGERFSVVLEAIEGEVRAVRVLIAEDDSTSSLVLERALAKWGYDVVMTTNGEAALDALLSPEAPPLAILDWMMPELDGVEVCRRLRAIETPQPIYVIILTARSGTQDIVVGLDAGANDYIGKPFNADELRARVEVGRRFISLNERLIAAQHALEVQARTDPLTGAMNVRAVLERLHEELARAERESAPLSLGILDIDNFKSVNDSYGHLAGDQVLRELVRRVSVSVRPYNVLGRIGGEEFLVILPGADAAAAASCLERIRLSISRAPFEAESHLLGITVSLGGVTVEGDPVDVLLRLADEALYRAKAEGRNCMRMACKAALEDSPPDRESPGGLLLRQSAPDLEKPR